MTDLNGTCFQKGGSKQRTIIRYVNGTVKRPCRSVQAGFSCPPSISNEHLRCRFTSSCTRRCGSPSCVGRYEKAFAFLRHARSPTNCAYLGTSSLLHLSSYWLRATLSPERVRERL